MLPRWAFGEGEVVLLSTVQGLVAEREVVRGALRDVAPTLLAIGLSPESTAAMLRYERQPDEDPFDDLADHDLVYSHGLSAFGEVDLPPPDVLEAVRHALAAGVPVLGVDFSDETYESLFTQEVGAWGFLKYGRVQRRLAKKPPRAADARAFSLAWDAAIRKVGGIAAIERARERQMANAAGRLAAQRGARVLLLVDAPREAGVAEHLASAGLPALANSR